MPTVTIADSPIGAKSDVDVVITYTPDQANIFAKIRVTIDKLTLALGDALIFNGTPFTYSSNLTTPTDFKEPLDLLVRFNDNNDFSRDYECILVSDTVNTMVLEFIAREATATLNITASATGGISINQNIAGQSQYSKNDLTAFSQLLRLEGNSVDNEQTNSSDTYTFEISSQVRGKLTPFRLEDGNGSIFKNEGSYDFIQVQIGTAFIDTGDTIRQKVYDTFIERAFYLGKQTTRGYITDRTGSKITSLELLEYCSFLIANYSDYTSLRRRVDVTYTDATTQTIIDGYTNNPTNGIVTCQAFYNSFNGATDNSKVIQEWTVSLANPSGDVIYTGQTYKNITDPCVNYFQVIFTNVYGGIEVQTFKTKPSYSYTVESSESRTGDEREFNFVTDKIETISIDEQNITENVYEVLKGLPSSKWVYVVIDGVLTPVRMTAFNLTDEKFNANFKINN